MGIPVAAAKPADALTADPANEQAFLRAADQLLRPVHVAAIRELHGLLRRDCIYVKANTAVVTTTGRTLLVETELRTGKLLLQWGYAACGQSL